MGPLFRMSAWLPPGLALGWLAVLATFVHGVGSLLTAWAATVSLVLLLVRQRRAVSASGPTETESDRIQAPDHASLPPADPTSSVDPKTAPTSPEMDKGIADGTAHSTSGAESAGASASCSPDMTAESNSGEEPVPSDSAPRSAPDTTASGTAGPARQPGIAEIAATLGLRVLTAAEVASVLRVDADVVTTAISDGELPGNQIGNHWRVDQGALARWLQGKYGVANPAGSPSRTEARTDLT
jgi:excisionase family DNA binding protein